LHREAERLITGSVKRTSEKNPSQKWKGIFAFLKVPVHYDGRVKYQLVLGDYD
jgi:hypothetical protein